MKSPSPKNSTQKASGVSPAAHKPVIPIDPQEEACFEAVYTLVEIHNSGYQGIQLNLSIRPDGFLHVSQTGDNTTPEGSIAQLVVALAEYGYQIATEDVMDLLERMYRAQGRQTPNSLPASARIDLHSI